MKSAALNHKICEYLVLFSNVKKLYQIFTCGTGRVSVLTCEELVWIHHIFEGINFTKCSHIMLYIEELESKAKPLQMGGFRECEEYVRIVHEILLHAHISHECEME